MAVYQDEGNETCRTQYAHTTRKRRPHGVSLVADRQVGGIWRCGSHPCCWLDCTEYHQEHVCSLCMEKAVMAGSLWILDSGGLHMYMNSNYGTMILSINNSSTPYYVTT